MKKSITLWILIIILIGLPICFSYNLNKYENPEILKQDYMQNYIDYHFIKINNSYYQIEWKVIDDNFYNVIKQCDIKDDNCFNNYADKNNFTIKNYKESKKNVLGLGSKYTFNEFSNNYLQNYSILKTKKDINKLKYDNKFPIQLIGNAFLMGKINPIENKEGLLHLYLNDPNYFKLLIGYSTIIFQFNNSLSSENLYFTLTGNSNADGFLEDLPRTRYLSIYKFSNISSGNINLTGLSASNSIYEKLDYFDDSEVNQSIWSNTTNICSTCTNTITEELSGNLNGYLRLHSQTSTVFTTPSIVINADKSTDFDIRNKSFAVNIQTTGNIQTSGNRKTNISIYDGTNRIVLKEFTDNSRSSFRFIVNHTDEIVEVYNSLTDTTPNSISVSSLNENTEWYISFGNGVFGGGTGPTNNYQQTEIYLLGINDNRSIYKAWTEQDIYPNNYSLKVSNYNTYINNTDSLTGTIKINLTQDLESSLNNGNCDCSGCVLDNDYCNIPIYFNSNRGSGINWNNLFVNSTGLDINVTFQDIDTKNIIYENLTVKLIDGILIENEIDNGNILYQGLNEQEYTITAFNENYPITYYYISQNDLGKNLTIYLLNNTENTNNVEFQIKSRDLVAIENVSIEVQRKFNNTNYQKIKNIRSDSGGYCQLHLDKNIEYRFIITHPNYITKDYYIFPFRTTYNIFLDSISDSVYNNIYDGIQYSIFPKNNQFNVSDSYQSLTFTIFSNESNLEYFGFKIINSSYECIPSECEVNSTVSNGGTLELQIKGNNTGNIAVQYYFKKFGSDNQFINSRYYVFGLIGGYSANALDSFIALKNELGGNALIAVVLTLLTSVIIIMATQIGILGLPLLLVISLAYIFFIITQWLNPVLGTIQIFWGIIIYIFNNRND